METKQRIKQWRAFQQPTSNKVHNSSTLLAEELNLKIYRTDDLKLLQIPIRGTCFSHIHLVEHYKQIKVAWSLAEVGNHNPNLE